MSWVRGRRLHRDVWGVLCMQWQSLSPLCSLLPYNSTLKLVTVTLYKEQNERDGEGSLIVILSFPTSSAWPPNHPSNLRDPRGSKIAEVLSDSLGSEENIIQTQALTLVDGVGASDRFLEGNDEALDDFSCYIQQLQNIHSSKCSWKTHQTNSLWSIT